MFSLNKDSVIFEHLSIRDEFHGEDKVRAYDLKFSYYPHNHKLEEFSPGLRASLYKPNENATADMLDEKHMPNMIHKCLPEIIKLRYDIPACSIRIYKDGTNDTEVFFKSGKADKFTILPKDGGSVPMTFMYHCTDPNQEYIAVLDSLLGSSMKIDLEQITVQDEDAAGAQSDAENSSGDIFGEGVKEQADQAQLDKVAQTMAADDDSHLTDEEKAEIAEQDRIAAEKANAIEPQKGRRNLKSVN